MADVRRFALHRYALGAILAVILLNLLARGLLRIGGVPATLLVAVLVALGLRWLYRRLEGRRPEPGAAWVLTLLYGAGLGLLYLGLWGLMWLKDEPGHMGQLLFVLHYLSYPVSLALALLLGRRPG
ncbi:hypothetical protein A9179_17195 [Pseudomonas alcaligenes]|uniref:Uncharacterized protein n=1 Tax=Aquipseudomonas alcaligenes TaxID=43263 RepID=A0ABR7S367_AQUAC|nr:hypothetical protein [Pseudomonas alcaligenes]MBC9252010.1 hypothetical protein [Pseudomonas alcaligenes]